MGSIRIGDGSMKVDQHSATLAFVTMSLAVCVGLVQLLAKNDKPAVPLDPVTTIIDAARRVPVIAFGEDHGSQATHSFLRKLIRDPRFASARIDVVVEFGNVLYQDVLDAYISGQDVPEDSLQRVWNYTTVGKGVWGQKDVYPRFFREARAVNASLPVQQRFRVIGGDPPVDWERADLGEFATRAWPASMRGCC